MKKLFAGLALAIVVLMLALPVIAATVTVVSKGDVATGYWTADGAAQNVSLGFTPSEVVVTSVTTTLIKAEWVTGMDGKMRYFKPRRIEIYKTLAEKIKRQAPGVTLYLSMESPEVWRRVLGGEPTRASVCKMLDRAAKNNLTPVSGVTT